MPTLSQRVDRATISVTLLPLPKGKKRGRAVGFWGGEPVASVESAGSSAPPFRWVAGAPQLVTYQDVKKVQPAGTSATQLVGCWYTAKHDERALVWTRTSDEGVSGVELHPEGWEKSATSACGDGQQVGYGYVKFAKDPSKALLWSGSRESMVVLTGPDPSFDASANGVAQGIQVGRYGGSIRQRACLWRGSSDSYAELHPNATELIGSEALGIGDGQQVGHVWGEDSRQMAAVWSGSPDSYVNLAPEGFVRSTAWRCGRGFQVGWATQKERGMSAHAMLWGGAGAADDFIDLQLALPEPWNVSQAMDLDVDGDTLRVIGTAQQAVQSGGYEMDAGSRPVMWEMKLLLSEPPARRETVTVQPTTAAAPAEMSDERKVEKLASDFAGALVEDDYDAAHALLAPWLQQQVTAAQLRSIIKKEFFADLAPVDFVVSGNDSTLAELREHYAEYHKNDATRTLVTAESFGDWGPPSIHIADEITPANFRQWLSIDLTPELENEFGLDFILRLWLIVVDIDGAMRIGHVEPGE
jgi:hypothetical protein